MRSQNTAAQAVVPHQAPPAVLAQIEVLQLPLKVNDPGGVRGGVRMHSWTKERGGAEGTESMEIEAHQGKQTGNGGAGGGGGWG